MDTFQKSDREKQKVRINSIKGPEHVF